MDRGKREDGGDMPIEIKTALLPSGETLAYRERAGIEPCVLLIHGNMASSALWEPLMEHTDINHRLIAVDLRGYGDSSYHRPVNAIKDFSGDLYYLVEHLGLDHVMLIGWSNGGGVAMQFAADYPDRVRKLLLLASISTRGYPAVNGEGLRLQTKEQIAEDPGLTMTFQANARQDRNYFENALNYLLFDNHQPDEGTRRKYIDACLKQRNMLDVADAANHFNISSISNGLTEGTEEIARIQCPVSVIWGGKDLITTQQMTQEILDDFTSHAKDVQYITLDAGHSPLIDDLDGLVASIHSFIVQP